MAVGAQLSFLVQSLKLCLFPLGSIAAATVALVLLPQGTEVLRTVTDEGLLQPLLRTDDFALAVAFLAGLATWSLSNWYSARLVLQRDVVHRPAAALLPAGSSLDTNFRTWFPRVLILLGILPIAGILFANGDIVTGIVALIVAACSFVLVLVRRRVLKRITKAPYRPGADALLTALPAGERLALWLGGAFSIVLVAALAMVNYTFARWIGGTAIFLLALSAISVFGSFFLIYAPKVFGWPAMTGMVVLLAIIFGSMGWTANHGIASRRASADLQSRIDRPLASEHFDRWLAANAGPANCPERICGDHGPIILVAAEGGASRSAWWSAHVLGVLDELTDGRFGARVFAASGISGGSLGVATWVALRRNQIDASANATGRSGDSRRAPLARPHPEQAVCERDLTQEPSTVKSACFLGRDFVAPILGYMLGVDLIQRFIPISIAAWDRSRGLEDTWTRDAKALFGDDSFGRPLLDLYRPPGSPATSLLRTDIPILLLNTATAIRGRPAVQAPVRLPDAEIDDLLEPALRTAGLTLAGAVHNSARFPYISPGGEVQAASGEHFDTVVDGGYVENSGALGLAGLMRSIHRDHSAHQSCQPGPNRENDWISVRDRLVVLFIANDPAEKLSSAKELCSSQQEPLDLHERKSWGEAATPPIGLYTARSSRADTSRRALLRELALCSTDDSHSRVYFVSMASAPVKEAQPVMSWYMTPQVRQTMWRAAATEPARSQLLGLVEMLGIDPEEAAKRLKSFGAMQ